MRFFLFTPAYSGLRDAVINLRGSGQEDSINTRSGERTVYRAGNALEAYIRGKGK